MKYLYLLLLIATLHANEEMVIDSGFAEYDGKKIILSQSVVVNHEMGKITADQMVLIPAENETKKLNFAFLEMEKDVEIALKEGGRMTCSSAQLDYNKLTGNFYGGDHYVVYQEECPGKGNTRIPLEVKARQMVLQLHPDKSKVTSIHATHDVNVDYNKDFLAIADEGVYQILSQE
jgi:hypothetical protein